MTDAAVGEPSSSTGQPRDELGLSSAVLAVLAVRYLRRDTEGRVVESTGEMIDRVAAHVAAAEDAYQGGTSDSWAEAFSGMMRAREFLPDSPTLMNAGGPHDVLAGCFVLPAKRRQHELVNPRTGRVAGTVSARRLFDAIVEHAWRSGEPGLLFLDRVNDADPLASQGRVVATTPRGEVPLRAYESCNVGSIDLARFARGGRVELDRLDATVRLAVRFLDDVIDVSRYPEPALRQAAIRTRRIGLGVMGIADLLAHLGIA